MQSKSVGKKLKLYTGEDLNQGWEGWVQYHTNNTSHSLSLLVSALVHKHTVRTGGGGGVRDPGSLVAMITLYTTRSSASVGSSIYLPKVDAWLCNPEFDKGVTRKSLLSSVHIEPLVTWLTFVDKYQTHRVLWRRKREQPNPVNLKKKEMWLFKNSLCFALCNKTAT